MRRIRFVALGIVSFAASIGTLLDPGNTQVPPFPQDPGPNIIRPEFENPNSTTREANQTLSTTEGRCTCWVIDEQQSGKVWECRLWGKIEGHGWWWFFPQGQEPSISPPNEVQSGMCQVTDGRREREEKEKL